MQLFSKLGKIPFCIKEVGSLLCPEWQRLFVQQPLAGKTIESSFFGGLLEKQARKTLSSQQVDMSVSIYGASEPQRVEPRWFWRDSGATDHCTVILSKMHCGPVMSFRLSACFFLFQKTSLRLQFACRQTNMDRRAMHFICINADMQGLILMRLTCNHKFSKSWLNWIIHFCFSHSCASFCPYHFLI